MMDEVHKVPGGLDGKYVTQGEGTKGNESKEGSTKDLMKIHKELARKFDGE